MKEYQYLDSIVIKTLKPFAKPPIIDRQTEDDSFWLDFPSKIYRVDISGIELSQWTVTMHFEFVDKFKKVAEIVGNEKAFEVLKALDL